MAHDAQRLILATDWTGAALPDERHATVTLSRCEQGLRVQVDSPFYDNPSPEAAAGSVAELWRYEVVEVFLLGAGERYLELELGPFGHYWALKLQGRRSIVAVLSGLRYQTARQGGRWQGDAVVSAAWLPEGLSRVNAFSTHEYEGERRFCAWRASRGPRPDFHDLASFGALVGALRS